MHTWARVLFLTLAAPGLVNAQRLPCPDDTALSASLGMARVVVVGRIERQFIDRKPAEVKTIDHPVPAVDRVVLSSNSVRVEYEIVATLKGHRDDTSRDFHSPLPEADGGQAWKVGGLYLLVLASDQHPPPGSQNRARYWTSSCWHSQQVASVAAATLMVRKDSARWN